MPALTVSGHDGDSAVTADDVAAIVQATRVVNIRLDEVHAGPLTIEGGDPAYSVRANLPKYAYAEEAEQILVRLEHEVKIAADGSLENSTEVSVAHVIAFGLEEDLNASPAALSAWIETNVYFLAYPYVRETLASLTMRMGLAPLTLDYLSRDELPFHSAKKGEQNSPS